MSISNDVTEDNEILAGDMHEKSHPANPLREREDCDFLTPTTSSVLHRALSVNI